MILKESIQQPEDNQGQNMEENDLQAMRRLLQEAYPSSDGRITARVMEQIRLEKEAGADRAAEGMIPDRAAKKARGRRIRGLVMKWGGMAACIAILCGAIVIASPMMNAKESAPDMAMYDAYEECAIEDGILADAAPEEQAEDAIFSSKVYAATEGADVPAEAETVVESSSGNTAGGTAESGAYDPAGGQPADHGQNTADIPEREMELVCAETQTRDPAEDAAVIYGSEALLDVLLDMGLLTREAYDAWMASSGCASAAEWTLDALALHFGLTSAQVEAVLAALP